ncbi:glycosyltransferase [Helicobacter aurati]|uniref:glycosyltransferase n=1 Tax=Helicobacter aurati TaxID=137778 RepID=UPI000CF065F6|nr:glycosyltransferase [Helicobacter aurati]
MLRVLHLVTQDNGGAGRACVRLHCALLKANVHSLILTQQQTSCIQNIHVLKQSKMRKSLTKSLRNLSLLPFRHSLKNAKDYFSPNIHIPYLSTNNQSLLRQIESFAPSIIHLHWIEGGFINIHNLASLTKPMLWSLHDENAYTGGCHYVAQGCEGARNGCRICPLFSNATHTHKTHKSFSRDISYLTFTNKQKTYNKLNLTINGLSSWIAKRAKESLLLNNKTIINLPNPIDTDFYKPLSQTFAKQALGIKSDKILLAFGAIGGSSVRRKGFFQLKTALKMLNNKEKYELLVFGGESENIDGIQMTNLGVIHDEVALVLLYNACDIFIQPSLAENLSNAIMESLSCGTAVVAFDIGGNGDMIQHKQNGYLAKPLDTQDLKNGIEWLANRNVSESQNIAKNARDSIIEKFSYDIVASQYITIYKQLTGGGGNP